MMTRLADRVPALIQIAAGVGTILVGLTVTIGWQIGSETLVRIRPELPEMQYTTSIGFAVAGVALLLAFSGRSKLSGIAGLLVGVAGALSLTQDFLHVDREVDHVFGLLSTLTASTMTPMRMAPNAAVCFILVGAALFLRRLTRSARVWALTILLGYAAAAIGIVAFTGYLADLAPAYQWGRLSSMAVHTAACFILFGAGVTGLGWEDSATAERGTWVRPLLVGAASMAVTVVVWQGLVSTHREQARYLTLTEARHLRTAITVPAEMQIRVLEEMARRWSVQVPAYEQWIVVASAYLRSTEGHQAFEIADADGRITWTAPLGHRPATGLAGAARARAIETAVLTRSTALSPLVDSDSGHSIYIAVPIYRDGGYFGAAVGVFRLTDQLMSALGQDAANDYHVALFDGATRVFGRAPEGDQSTDWGTSLGLRVREATWRLGVWPTGSRIDQLEGPLPSVLLAGGILLSALASAIVFVVGVRRRRERELKYTTEQLQEQDRQREAAQVALRASEERYRSLIDGAIDIIYRVDANGRFTFVNPVAARVMNREPAALLGCHFLELVAPEAKAEVARFYSDQLTSRVHDTYLEFPAIGGDGRTVWIGQNVQMLVEENGQYGFQAVARDITERKRADAGLAAARDQALETTRLKSQFVANMSHELRTPMNGILGLTELLLETELNDEQRDHAQTVRSCGETLLALLNDILDLSKIEAGRMELHNEPFDIRHLIQQTADLFEEKARRKGVDLVYVVHHDVPKVVVGDPGRIRQVLTNLLGNAVKFTAAGEITVRVGIDESRADGMLVRFDVTDTGIGISPESQEQLFQPFVQADGSITRRYGGTGLGLVISRQLSELMGGRLDLSSEPGRGSTFWFTIRVTETSKVPAASEGSSNETLHGLRVLVVNDSEGGRRRMRELLESWDMQVIDAIDPADGLAALETAALRRQTVDVMVVELLTSIATAIDFAAAVKKRSFVRPPRIVLLVGRGQPGDAERARQAGASAYLTKPIRQSQLFDCMATVMSPSRPEGMAAPEAETLVTRHTLVERREAFREPLLVVEDNPVNQKVLIGFLRRLGYRADVAANGRQALAALERRSYALVFMDSQMPEMDGLAATAEIRRREGDSRHTTIAAVTAHAMQGERERCLAAGMDDYLSKPYTIEQLAALVKRWLPADAEPADDGTAPLVDERPTAPANAGMDLSVLDGLRALETDAPGIVADVIETFLRDAPAKLGRIADALAATDATGVERNAHGLKGSAGAIGATRMFEFCDEIERRSGEGNLGACREPAAALADEFARVRAFLEPQIRTAA